MTPAADTLQLTVAVSARPRHKHILRLRLDLWKSVGHIYEQCVLYQDTKKTLYCF
ncbi:hypothetical protein WOLCODRAFT_138755 [Wolfiporia cocos MD-104 SS10]|uniref:Uncharacterized protein n=1 Tax=Wolfiporia cocos (strain MD-104) TaxID=742152 RepID=A0A2H3JPB4_WOLCO|nr:hypothetical protein WOLCODRAFT_138755 [Wolfiporia cocos MD-104 SS10]